MRLKRLLILKNTKKLNKNIFHEKKINRKKGILFWITGLSGSGKTTLAKKFFQL